ncbi:MAG TPA: hypothetical protein VHX86_15650 [Tepidisphaeraceae bacterium]|jgi:hypothetical protein|nr:hypothetical protein [Tepidisphaeraceae bacterium]
MGEHDCVQFGNKSSSLPGAIAGAAIAIGVPAVTLIWGGHLAASVQLTVVILGVSVGGLIALTATFFSLVIPSSVNCSGCQKSARELEATDPAQKTA